jgi:hypothetical protein
VVVESIERADLVDALAETGDEAWGRRVGLELTAAVVVGWGFAARSVSDSDAEGRSRAEAKVPASEFSELELDDVEYRRRRGNA